MTRSVIPWRGWRPVEKFESEMQSLVDRFFGPEERWFRGMRPIVPEIDVAETDTSLEVKANLPGLRPEELKVEVRDGELWISGEKKEEKEENGKTFHRVERRYGQFRRVVPLPSAVDAEKVEASYTAGVLSVVLPKREDVKGKPIEVKTTK